MSLLDKIKSLKPVNVYELADLSIPVTCHDLAYLSIVARRYHVQRNDLLRVIFDTGLDTLAKESGVVRK